LRSASANILGFTSDLDVIELNTEHVLEQNIIPVNFTREFGGVVVTEGQVRFYAKTLVLFGRKGESKDVALQKFLFNHLIENWGHSLLGQRWVCHTNDGFEIGACENCSLLFNISEFLVFDVNLST
jgi:hypothetical protein